LVAFGISQYFLNLFNIDFNQFKVSTVALEYTALSALAAPVLAGLPPILQGAGITVRDAIASYGLGGRYGSSRFDRTVDRIGARWLSSPYATALGNMFRRKGRLLLTELVLVTAGSAFLMVMSLNSSIGLTLDNIFARNRYDTLIQFTRSERTEHVEAIASSVAGVDRIELHLVQSASMYVSGQLVKEAGLGSRIEGIPAGSDFYKPLIVSGRWLLPGDGRAVVLTRDVAQKNKVKVGDSVILDLGALGTDTWKVVGLYDPIFASSFSADTIYAPQDALYKATKKYGQGTILYVRTSSHAATFTADVTSRLKNLFDDRGMNVVQSQTQSELRSLNTFQFGMVVDMMLGLSVIVALVGGIALMGALSIGVIERTKEIGVMRAVGARSRTILGVFIMEGVLQGLLSWLVAAPISLIASPLLAAALGKAMFGATLDYRYNWVALLIWLLVILGVSTIASVVPANRATRISVRDSLAYA
jgi:putative ABC transport system permease protein